MKKYILILSFICLIGLAGAEIQEVQYTIEAGEDRADINTSVYMTCDSVCTGLKWSIPEDSQVLFVRNSRGQMDYEINDNTLDIPGSRAGNRENETIKIGTVHQEDAEEVYSGLYQRRLSIPSFKGVDTTGFVQTSDLISGRVGFGFDHSFSEDEMRFKGSGPTNIRIKFGEGYTTSYFEFFGSEPENTDSAYEVPIGVLGFQQKFDRFPVAVMSEQDYDQEVNEWSSGEYVGGGIKIRKPENIENDFLPVLAHEVVHGVNDRKLNWDQTSSSYFDEGVSKHVESLMRKKAYREGETDRKNGNLFGSEKEYRVKKDGQRYVYTVPSKGDQDVLWNYYQEDRDFMKNWNAFEGDEDTRSFGYAYSEFLIANYVSRQDGSIRQLYNDLEVNQKVNNPETKWSIFSDHLDMTPCKFEEREQFEQCIEEVNSYDYPVYSAKPSDDSSESLSIDRLKVPNRTETSETEKTVGSVNLTSANNGFKDSMSGLFGFLSDLFQKLTGSL